MRTAEFVSPKNTDKLCDIISDTILDRFLEKDSNTNCIIETVGYQGNVSIIGKVISNDTVTDDEIKDIVNDIAGVNETLINLSIQPPNPKQELSDTISYNSGISIGYASTETISMMPFEYELCRGLNKFIYDYYPFDGKTQITINGNEIKVICSFQNSKSNHLDELIDYFFKNKVDSILSSPINFKVVEKICNPLGDSNMGGFDTNIGLTGRKCVVDNYGPRIPIGGGNFSGKDGTDINRSAAYMARKIAVDSVKEYNLKYALVELSYSTKNHYPIQAGIKGNEHGINTETGLFFKPVSGYDLSINGIIESLDLKKPQFSKTSMWGHFGNGFKWDIS